MPYSYHIISQNEGSFCEKFRVFEPWVAARSLSHFVAFLILVPGSWFFVSHGVAVEVESLS